jgi:hypothetical protein
MDFVCDKPDSVPVELPVQLVATIPLGLKLLLTSSDLPGDNTLAA